MQLAGCEGIEVKTQCRGHGSKGAVSFSEAGAAKLAGTPYVFGPNLEQKAGALVEVGIIRKCVAPLPICSFLAALILVRWFRMEGKEAAAAPLISPRMWERTSRFVGAGMAHYRDVQKSSSWIFMTRILRDVRDQLSCFIGQLSVRHTRYLSSQTLLVDP